MNVFIAEVKDNLAMLTAEESWHCFKVLRKKEGEKINIIDGKGAFYEGTLNMVSEKKCTAEIFLGPNYQAKRNYYLHLAIAPTKQIDRIEWMLEKVVEMGIDEVSFIQCKNSERVVIKHERILKIVESAVKQSLQAYIPKVNELLPFKEIVLNGHSDQKLIAHCTTSNKVEFKTLDFKNKSTLILIGPEGDFTNEEINLATENNFLATSLGTTRLRTETAGLYVCQAVSILS